MVSNEQRKSPRYEIRLPLRYRVSQKGAADMRGSATTYDISAFGLSFRSRRPLPVGAHIELIIDWPARMGDGPEVDLHVTGFVLRSDPRRTAVFFSSRKFRVHEMDPTPMSVPA